MTLAGKNIITAESLTDTLDLLSDARDEAQGATQEARAALRSLGAAAQAAADQAAARAAPALLSRVTNLETAAQDAMTAALAVTVAGDNHVPTVEALDQGAAEGASAYVEADGLIYRRTGGKWVPRLDYSAAKHGSGFASSLYTLAVEDIAAQINPRMFRAAHRAIVEGRPLRIAFAGDSITEGGDTSPFGRDRWADRTVDAIKAAMPGVGIESFNFSLGGRQLAQMVDPNYKALAAEPSDLSQGFSRPGWPGWVVGKAWRTYIQEWNPDVIFVAHGMNDASYGLAGVKKYVDNLNAFLNDMQGWASNPDPVLVAGFESTSRQDSIANPPRWVRAYARATRSLTKKRGLALVDAHRLDRALRAGVDDGLTAAKPLLQWQGYEDQSEWTTGGYAPALWTVARGPNPLEWSTLAPSGDDNQGRVVYTRRMAGAGFLDVTAFARNAATIAMVEMAYRPDEDTGLMAICTPQGSSNGPARVDFLLRTTGEVLASQPVNWAAGQELRLQWTWRGGQHTVTVFDAAGAHGLQFEALHASWDGAVRFTSAGGDFQTAEYRNLSLYLWEPLGTGRAAPVVREAEVMGVWPIRWPQTQGNGMNHVDNAGGALIYYAACLGVIRTLALLPSLPGTARADVALQNGWVPLGGNTTPRVSKSTDGRVLLSGMVKVPAKVSYPVVIGNLPAGFRTGRGTYRQFTTSGQGYDLSGPAGPDDMGLAFAEIAENGDIRLFSGPGEGGWVDVGGLLELA